MNAPVTRRALLGATAAVGALSLPAVAEAGIPTALHAHPDAELLRLLETWRPARAAADTAGDRLEELWMTFADQEPPRPDALRVRAGDGFNVDQSQYRTPEGGWQWWYEIEARDELRALPPPNCTVLREGLLVTVPDERRIARRAEILAALDAWWAQCDIVKDRLGLGGADEVEEAACDALGQIEAVILATSPATFAGLAAKARWASWDGLPRETAAIWAKRMTADVLALSERGGVVS